MVRRMCRQMAPALLDFAASGARLHVNPALHTCVLTAPRPSHTSAPCPSDSLASNQFHDARGSAAYDDGYRQPIIIVSGLGAWVQENPLLSSPGQLARRIHAFVEPQAGVWGRIWVHGTAGSALRSLRHRLLPSRS